MHVTTLPSINFFLLQWFSCQVRKVRSFFVQSSNKNKLGRGSRKRKSRRRLNLGGRPMLGEKMKVGVKKRDKTGKEKAGKRSPRRFYSKKWCQIHFLLESVGKNFRLWRAPSRPVICSVHYSMEWKLKRFLLAPVNFGERDLFN